MSSNVVILKYTHTHSCNQFIIIHIELVFNVIFERKTIMHSFAMEFRGGKLCTARYATQLLNCIKHLVKDLSKHLFERIRLNG